ncbi:MAG: alpha/beta fold hydrolase [Rhodospirillaceae bacterium]|jgi:pimeloyl-ACP methyl ester carboxylesterase|nr:alpha/beta fold hydrolase [Rhodospirillaceae bacterium]MBT5566249.1 alpha/beta fold hydrolase [Rhodospirillaceae bacterium]MBT6088967.1 alpha/beta fold hydrolase [Rhodospirillaceae bacterium]MBT6961881.1 alpha/beta fold hydrolase [Rhodospirillaceae bacterium]
MIKVCRRLFAAIVLLTAAPVVGQDITSNVITLLTDDGAQVPAMLMHPATGMNTHGPGVVIHHGGPGGHPARGCCAPRWAGEHLAKLGYTVVSPLSRHSSGRNAGTYRAEPFETATLDVKAAVDFLAQLGAQDIVLAGHSLGSIRITRYMIDTQDTRVKAMAHYAPTRDMPEWMRANMGHERYLDVVDKLSTLVSEGRGDEYIYEVYEASFPAPPGNESASLQTARNWLNWWGPAAQTRNTVWFEQLTVPQLLLSGDKDTFVTMPYMEELKAAAVNAPSVGLRWYEGGIGHLFQGARAEASQDTSDWLAEIGLGPRSEVTTRFVDTQTAAGRERSGVFYAPADGSGAGKPAFMVVYGYGGDIMWSSNHWLCVRLAQAGHACLAGQTGGSGPNVTRTTLESEMSDFAGWADWLDKAGYEKIVMAGHSWGGIRITRYLVTSNDPRVSGMVYLAPTRDAGERLEQGMGKEAYQAIVKEAQAIADAGDNDIVIAEFDMAPPAPPGSSIVRPQTATSFLSHWGPNANTVHTKEMRKVKVPVLSIAGSEDPFVDEPFLKAFTRAAGGKAEYQYYDDGAPHSLVGWEDRTTADIIGWVGERVE